MQEKYYTRCNSTGFRAFLWTSFFGAFNDNFFKLILICYAMSVLSKEALNTYIPITGLLFTLPYLLGSSYAGYISDRFAKKRVLLWAKWLEIAVMALGLWLFIDGAVYGLLLVLFLMGAQSALYSPAKYGFLPETLPERELSNGNGLTQLFTFVAIIAGTWMGGMVSKWHSGAWWIGSLYCVIVAIAGTVTSFFISKTPAGTSSAQFLLNPIATHINTFRSIRKDRKLVFSIFGFTFFWYVAALFQNNMPLFVKNEMHLGEQHLGFLLGASGLGIGLGCLLCGKIMKPYNEFTISRFSCLGMGVSCILMGFANSSMAMGIVFSFLLGLFAGFYQIPMSTNVQKRCPASKRGSCLALGNAIDCISMILAYSTQWVLINIFRINASGIFIVLGIIAIAFIIIYSRKNRQ